jgi:hypothetical protein
MAQPTNTANYVPKTVLIITSELVTYPTAAVHLMPDRNA